MKNPLKSVKKLRDRVRGTSSRASRDLLAGRSSVDDAHRESSPESEALTTPTQSATPRATDDESELLPTVDSETTPRQQGGFAGKLLEKGKLAATKTVSFAKQTANSAATNVAHSNEGEAEPETEVPPPNAENNMLPAVEEANPPAQLTANGIQGGTSESSSVIENLPEEQKIPVAQEKPAETEAAGSSVEAGRKLGNVRIAEPQAEPSAEPQAEVPAVEESPAEERSAPGKEETEEKIYPVHGKTLIGAVLGAISLFVLLVISIFGVSKWETAKYSILTLAGTLGYCYLYAQNVKRKRARLEALRITPGVTGLRTLLKELPTWMSYTKKDRVEWLNKCLSQMWPSYDKAVCAAIKETVEPLVQSVKPPIFKDIKFSRLKFGDVPFRIEGVEIFDITESEIVLDMDVRWHGGACVTLSIEPNIPSMTDVTRMEPKVTDISCFGTVRLIFKPLVSEMPGFGAVIATFVRTPTVRFNIDFGKALGGSVSGKMVKTALDSFIRETLVNLYVWPQRMVIPIIYDEDVTGPIENLQLRHVGLLTVKVIQARDLPAADMNGYSDPTLELWTRPERKYNTAVVKKTLNPVWDDEVHHLLIQEPRAQNISVTAYDVDVLNVSDMFKSLNIIKNLKEAVYAKEFLGRALIPVRPISERPGEEIDQWFDLGSNGFGHPDGPGCGCGSFHLKMVYTPFSMLNTNDSKMGAVLVTVIRCRDLLAMDRGGTSDPYVRVKLKETIKKTHVVNASCDPEFHINFEFFEIPITEVISISVFDKDFASRDDPLGSLEISLLSLAKHVMDQVPGCMRQWFKLNGVSHGDIQLKLQYIPMDTTTTFFK